LQCGAAVCNESPGIWQVSDDPSLFHQKSRDRRDLRDPLADELVRPFHKALPLLETLNCIEQIFGSSGSLDPITKCDLPYEGSQLRCSRVHGLVCPSLCGHRLMLSWRVGRPLIQLNSERLIPCVEHDLSKGCGADDRGDAEAQQQEFSPLGRGQQDATHDQHLRREAQCCYQRRRCRGHVGLLIGSICHGVNPADGGNDLRPAICQKRSASCKTPIMKKQIG
jgi:hypothetical protein